MPGTIFWDVDTQYDFIMPDGKLYVTASEKRLPNLKKLTDYARQRGIPIYGSVDNHQIDDPEISDTPDFQETFPPSLHRRHRRTKKSTRNPTANPPLDRPRRLGRPHQPGTKTPR